MLSITEIQRTKASNTHINLFDTKKRRRKKSTEESEIQIVSLTIDRKRLQTVDYMISG